MAEIRRILIIGGTGYFGKFFVEASAKSGHPTFLLLRESALSDPAKAKLVEGFKSLGVTMVPGSIYDHEGLVKVLKQVDIVISTIGATLLPDQVKLVAAIKEAGNIKRFLPSEFGNDVDRVEAVEPAKSLWAAKVAMRRHIEASGVPYTFVCCNFFNGYFLPTLCQNDTTSPPRDKVVILGDGNPKVIFNYELDIANYSIRAAEDSRLLNKILYIRPSANIYSMNELVSLWEKKIGKTLDRIYVPEEEVLKQIKEAPEPLDVVLSISHSAFIKGSHTNFEIDPAIGFEATKLYPDIKYTTVDEYLNQFV